MTAAPPSAIDAEVIELARNGEPERYLAATLAPQQHREALIALAAFSADLRRIPHLVKEPMMGEIRLQWWRDVIATFGTGATPTGHPIADALAAAIRKHGLPAATLIAMTEARAFDLYPDPMPDRAALDGYLTKTEAVPFELALKVLGVDHAPATRAAELAARAYGLARLLADLPLWLARGRNPLPLDLLARHQVDAEALMRGEMSGPIRSALAELTGEIRVSYAQARSRCRDLLPSQRAALLPIATIPAYLAQLEAPGRAPLRLPVELAPLSRVWRIARAHWVGP